MIRDITLGQYYVADSIIHKLDSRVKLFSTLVFFITMFISKNVLAYFFASAFVLAVITLSKIPFTYVLRSIKPLLFLLMISVVFNLFLTPGEIIFNYSFINITKEGVIIAIKMAMRLVFLVFISSILTFTTTPSSLTSGLEKSLSFLKVFKVPVAEVALMMSISLRFIPILIEETDKIMKAQMSRGADFDKGNLIEKAKSLIPLLIPLFVSAFRRANDLAEAMESRCYSDSENRTKLNVLKYKRNDYITYIIMLAYTVLIIITRYIKI